jgi:hypothetical protein
MKLTLSTLPKTWIFDLDGLLVPHNGHLHGGDRLLPGVSDFWAALPAADTVVLLTARAAEQVAAIREFFAREGLRFDHVVPGCPTGERILFNDAKPSGLRMAHAVNLPRDAGLAEISVQIDPSL